MRIKQCVTMLVMAMALCATDALGQEKWPTAGPLVGHATATTTTLWVYAPKNSAAVAMYAQADKAEFQQKAAFVRVKNPAADLGGVPMKVTLKNLKPDTRYTYRVKIDGKSDDKWAGTFKTAPATDKPAKFRLGLTSCMRIGKPQKSWNLFLKQNIDLHLTVGDTHYANTTQPKTQWTHHLRYRNQPEFAQFIRNVPTYAMWDDHDYGPNNSDGTAKGKENSLRGWNQFWANPAAGTADTPGAFFSFTWGEVEIFMVDNRYHRSPNKAKDDDNKRMIGDAQYKWLVDGLKNSKAKFKVIASGSTLHHSKVDGWRIYTFARRRLFDAIKENKIPGVLYMSGDIHSSLVWTHNESDRVGYPFIEVISSGIANSKTLSFATVDFDTTREDPTVTVRIVLGDGSLKDKKTWKLSQLQVK